jgi:hypothetical protein
MSAVPVIVPGWRLSARVRAFSTLRAGGASSGRFGQLGTNQGGMNLGRDDDPEALAENRRRFRALLPAEPLWLEQVHGTRVVDAAGPQSDLRADAVVAHASAVPCVIRTADCLPVFIADAQGRAVGLAHAGWRGLLAGVIEATVQRMRAGASEPLTLEAWLGPAISQPAFEVGDEVRNAFVARDPRAAVAFERGLRPGKWQGDLYALARQRLANAGIITVGGGMDCTVRDDGRFYSFRRDGVTGRMAHAIWIADGPV